MQRDQWNRFFTLNVSEVSSYRVEDKRIDYRAKKMGHKQYKKYINLFTKVKGYYIVPSNLGVSFESKSNPKINITLHDYQTKALDFCQRIIDSQKRSGLVVAGGGTGKTIMMLLLAMIYKTPTVIVVPTTSIQKGFIKDYSLVGNNEMTLNCATEKIYNTYIEGSYPDILVVTHQTFNKIFDKLNGKYKLLLLDEADMLPSTRISQLCLRKGNYFGFTGTPKRKEFGKEGFDILFNDTYTIQQTSLPAKVGWYKYQYDYSLEEYVEYGKDLPSDSPEIYRRLVCNNQERNQLIYNLVVQSGFTKVIVFTDRTYHVNHLYEIFSKTHNTLILDGSINKEKFFEDVSKLKSYVIVANMRSGGRGFNLPEIECGVLTTSTSWDVVLKQSVRRSTRKHGEKEFGYYIDIVDYLSVSGSKVKTLGWYERKKTYQSMNRDIYQLQNPHDFGNQPTSFP